MILPTPSATGGVATDGFVPAPAADADAFADAAGAALGHRVTLIDPTGRVIGDSEFDEPALGQLENHSARPEVRAAAGDEELYVAVPAPRGVARVSIGTRSVEELFDRARRDVYAAGLVALLASTVLAYLFSRTVSRPIVELRDVAQAMAAGDLSRRPALSAPGEVGDLLGPEPRAEVEPRPQPDLDRAVVAVDHDRLPRPQPA